jgi:hypothetical protein
MVYTNPNAISNSGNQQNFTNQKAKIHKFILNVIDNGDILNNFLVQQFNEYQTSTGTTVQTSSSTNDNDFITILQNQKKNSKYSSFIY